MARKLKLFYSYAHRDERLRKQLETHLGTLKREDLIEGWHDRNIDAGTDWQQQINTHLEEADIILLLVSPDFINSDYCYSIEATRAMERFENREAVVIPILLRPSDLQHTPFSRLQVLPRDARAITLWKNRDQAFLDTAQQIRRVIENFPGQSQRDGTSPPPPKNTPPDNHSGADVQSSPERPWNAPRRNPFFTGREDLLALLRERLTSTGAATLSQTQAIRGLGGVGKTQTAIEYAHRYRDAYSGVFCVSVASRENMQSDVVKLAYLLNLPEKDAPDQNIMLESVQHWLVQQPGWLLVLDNADDLAIVDEFLPPTETLNGHILITTRAQALGALTSTAPISVEEMDREEGALLLLRRARLLVPGAPLSEATPEDRIQAEAIVDALDGLPLALDQAGAYVEETGCSLSDYHALYRSRRKDLLNWLSNLPPNHPRPVATAWDISFQKVAEANPAAVDLLRLCSFLDADAIPEELFTAAASELGSTLQPVAADPFKLNAAIEALRRYSLIRRDPATKALTIHRLVQAVLVDRLDEETQRQWAELTVRAVNEAFPYESNDYRTWPLCRRLLPHVQTCANLIDQYTLVVASAGRLLHLAATYLYSRALYEQAEVFFQRALLIEEKVGGPEDTNAARTLHGLANVYRDRSKYEQAEEYYQRALQISEKGLGPEHPETANTLQLLGSLYQAQRKYEQAEEYYQRALQISKKVEGPEHPSTAVTLHELGRLYQAQGKYEQAQEHYQRALRIYEKELGREHLSTAIILAQIATLSCQQEKYEQAQELYQRALPVLEKVLGYEHPTTVAVVNNYVFLLQQMGRDAEAAEWLGRVEKA